MKKRSQRAKLQVSFPFDLFVQGRRFDSSCVGWVVQTSKGVKRGMTKHYITLKDKMNKQVIIVCISRGA